MSLRNREGSDNNTETMSTPNLLNTPLANTMKKIGMTPMLGNKLNKFVVKKNTAAISDPNSALMTLDGDGTGGP